MIDLNIWIDADSCPKEVRTFVIQSAKENSTTVNFVANKELPFIKESDFCKLIVCEKEKNSADNYIFENAKGNDIVITRDILFAERLVEKNICVMNDRGFIFTKFNIQDKIIERNFNMNLAEIGLGSKNKKTYYSEKEFKKFSNCFLPELQKHILQAKYEIAK